jgi:gliding motility-associated-like protein
MKTFIIRTLIALAIALPLFTGNMLFAEGFVPNIGQWPHATAYNFKLEAPGSNVYVSSELITFHFYRSVDKVPADYTDAQKQAFLRGDFAEAGKKVFFYRIDLKIEGANPKAEVSMHQPYGMMHHYSLSDSEESFTHVPGYAEVRYHNIYPNIDLILKYTNGVLKYEFEVRPGGKIHDIKLQYEGAENIQEYNGGLRIVNGFADIYETAPACWTKQQKKPVAGNFQILTDDRITFDIQDYDKNETLIIDPSITWATYYTNNYSSDFHANSVIDAAGNGYIAYATYANVWPVIDAGSGQYYDATRDGITDIVIARINTDRTKQWATYFGGDQGDYLCGTGGDYGKTLALDNNGNVFLAGYASAPTSFPTLASAAPGAWNQTALKGGDNSFIAKFNPNGILQWSTMYNHTNVSASGAGIRINGIAAYQDKIYFTGQTYKFSGFDIPLVNLSGAYNNSTFVGSQDAFLGRISTDGILEWSTYFNGGNAALDAYCQGSDLTIDASGNLWYAGQISGTDAAAAYLLDPGGGAYFSNTIAGNIDVTLAKFNSSLQPEWSTIIGGTGLDRVSEISTDINGNALVVNRMARAGFPTIDPGGGAFYYASVQSASNDGFIMKFTPSGAYSWGTYVAGTTGESSTTGVTSDAAGNILVLGYSSATDFPIVSQTGSYNQASSAGGNDLFLMEFSANGICNWSTYYGGSGADACYGVKINASSGDNGCGFVSFNSFNTSSTDLPVVDAGSPAFFEPTAATANNNALLELGTVAGSGSVPPSSVSVSQPNICAGSSVTLSVSGGSLSPGDQWQWYSGSCGGTYEGSGTNITVNPIVATDYYVRAEGPCGNTNCVMVTVTVTGTGTEDASWTQPGTLCQSAVNVDLQSYVTGDAGGIWSGSGMSGSVLDLTAVTGNTDITYTVGTMPCEVSVTYTINVEPDVDPIWTSPGTVCESSGTIDLNSFLGTANSGGSWSGTGVTGTDFNPAALTGSISITYTVGNGSCTETSVQSIDIIIDVDASWTLPAAICPSAGIIDLNTLITGTPGGLWSGQNVSGSQFDPTALSDTIIDITYTVGTMPCEELLTQTVQIISQADAAWAPVTGICAGSLPIDLSVYITGDTGGIFTGIGVTGNMFDPTGLTGFNAITYTVGSGTCTDSELHSIQIIDAPGDPIVAISTDTICSGESILMTASSGGPGNVYIIYQNNDYTGAIGNAPLTYFPSATDTLYLAAMNVEGCYNPGGPVSIPFTVLPLPPANAGPDTLICMGDTITLTATGGLFYSWSNGVNTASQDIIVITTTQFQVTVSDNYCSNSDFITVRVDSTAQAIANNDAGSTTYPNSALINLYFNDQGDAASIHVISPPSGGSYSISAGMLIYNPNSGFTGTDTLTYQICDDNCPYVCDEGIAVIVVEIDEPLLPSTGFSPNDDGVNDVFIIQGIENFPDNKLSIFNRWGNLVYSMEHYDNSWNGASNTDGTLYGDRVPRGTYYFILQPGEDYNPVTGYIEIKY